MKKIFHFYLLIVSVLFAFISASCSKNEDDIVLPETSSLYEPSCDYKNFMSSIDSLNNLYLSNVSISQSRGLGNYISNRITENVADNAGRLVGGFLGKHIGCFIGGIAGSPVGAIGGYVVGRWAGRIVGSVVASYGISCYFLYQSRAGGSSGQKDSIDVKAYLPKDCEIVDDSIGYYHNLVMQKLSEHPDLYVDEYGNPNCSLIYDDCVRILKENGIYNEEVSQNLDFKKDVISYINDNIALSKDFLTDKISKDLYNTELINGIKSRGVPDEEVAVFADFAIKITETCVQLPIDEKIEYADELNDAISNSTMDAELKEELRSTTNMVVNSSICSETLK